jgi:carbon storage regulator
VNAPKDVAVHREEIYEKIQHEKSGGASGSGQGDKPTTEED